MRIAVVTQEEPFYLPPALLALCGELGSRVVALVALPSFNERARDTARRLYRFYGPVDFTRLLGRYAWARLADGVNRRVAALTRPYSVGDVARRLDLPLHLPRQINSAAFRNLLQGEIRPDLLVSMAASQVFKKKLLAIPRLGCINLHSAPLPRFQGMMPNFWTMVHGESEAAVTVHYMAERLDSGDILLQRSFPIAPHYSLHDLMVESKRVGVRALLEAIERIGNGTADPRPMDPEQASYFSFPGRADAARLRAMGRSLF